MLGQNRLLHHLLSRFPPCNRCNSSFQPCSQLQSPVPGWLVVSLGVLARGNVPFPVAAQDAALGLGGDGERDGPGTARGCSPGAVRAGR